MVDIVNYKGYDVYSDGRIKSNGIRKVFLSPYKTNRGYLGIKINEVSTSLHSVIAESFLGERPEGYTVNHKDGDKLNNCISNLEYMSRKDNYLHALKSGLKRNISNYLTADEASDMVEFYCNTDYTMKEICSWFNLNRVVLSYLLHDKHKYLYKN